MKKKMEKAAEKNNAEALVYLGRMAFSGLGGITKSQSRARTYYSHAAKSGNLIALYNMGIITANGFGTKASCPDAVTFFRKVLELSLFKSSSLKAYKYYSKGQLERALIQYELAADQGDILAQINTAWLYEKGIDSHNLTTLSDTDANQMEKSSQRKALEFYTLAAEQGSPLAHLKVGDYHYYGWSVNQNTELAGHFYQIASGAFDAQATFNLGWMHHYVLD